LCILFVEDEPLIRLILAEELTDAGFEVCQAENGDEAAKLIQGSPIAFTLLITDIHMPGERDGVAVARLMHRQNPLIPVIYITGRPDIFNKMTPVSANTAILAKPFLPSELARVARHLLGQKGAGGHER
jgi:DNA-binding response OmpR family regulator